MVDFHAHILPGADHGSDSILTSLKQVRAAKKAGITTIIATPHFYKNNDSLDDFILRREKTYNILKEAMKQTEINMNIIKACEVNLQVDLFNINDFRPLCIEGTNYMLLEMPMNINWTKWHYDAVDEFINLGIRPIIAHINRYSSYYLEKLFEKDVLFQINIESFRHFSSRQRIKHFYKKDCAHFIGSDIHGTSNVLYDEIIKYREKYPKMFNTFDINALRVLNSKKR